MNTTAEQHAAALLRQKRLRVTAPRVAVIAAILQSDRPLTQQQIAAQLGDKAPNKTTIYRTLLSLIDADLVHKAFVQQRQWHLNWLTTARPSSAIRTLPAFAATAPNACTASRPPWSIYPKA